MRRRKFITLLGSAAAYPATGWGQEAKLATIPRIGAGVRDRCRFRQPAWRCLVAGLAPAWLRRRQKHKSWRRCGRIRSMSCLGSRPSSWRRNVNVIFAPSSTEVEPARQTTTRFLLCSSFHADPVGVGHVASLPRPGGNITGLTMLLTHFSAKELEILKDAVPQGGAHWRVVESYNPFSCTRLEGDRGWRRKSSE